ncbi:MAG: hypothetical protein A2046_16915 [Bacteroidetes bacterium GWA2_30_7]|nr:MAG: hypothetical protein A2046_16915 [Bacteroidetes bacterium GWA2_30_7]
MRLLFLLYIVVFSIICSYSNASETDSLEVVLLSSKEVSKPEILNRLSELYLKNQPEKSYEYAGFAIELSKKFRNIKEESKAVINFGNYYRTKAKKELAIEYLKKSLEICNKFKLKEIAISAHNNLGLAYLNFCEYDNAIEEYTLSITISKEINDKKNIAYAYTNIGIIYKNLSNYKKAIEFSENAIKVYEEIGDKDNVASAYNTIGQVYWFWGKFDKTLENFQKALTVIEQIGDKQKIANMLLNIGHVYRKFSDFNKAENEYNKAINTFKELDNKAGIAAGLNSLGNIYIAQNNIAKALENFNASLKLSEEIKNKPGIASSITSIGDIYLKSEDFEKALEYYNRALQIKLEIGNMSGIADSYNSIANIYKLQGNYQKAMDILKKGFIIADSLKLKETIMKTYLSFAEIDSSMGDFKQAFVDYKLYKLSFDSIYNENSNKILKELQTQYETTQKEKEIELLNKDKAIQKIEIKRKNSQILIFSIGLVLIFLVLLLLYRQLRLNKKAHLLLRKQKNEIEIQSKELEKLSIVASETDNSVVITDKEGNIEWVNDGFNRLYGYTLNEFVQLKGKNLKTSSSNPKISEVINEAISNKKSVTYSINTQTKNGQNLWVQTTLTPIYSSNSQLHRLIAIDSDVTKIKEAEEEIKIQQKELVKAFKQSSRQQIELHKAMIQINEQKQKITDSIVYARRIQNAIFPPDELVSSLLPEHFILNKPRDIVSGDFYWITKKETYIAIAVADCTGHGVPGAFMSMLGITLLNEITSSISFVQNNKNMSSEILNQLKANIIISLHQTGKEGEAKDGMDISLCIIDVNNKYIQYSGANNSVYIVRSRQSAIELQNVNSGLIELKPDKMPIGIYMGEEKGFISTEMFLPSKSMLYMFSDGYPDQFGGEKDKKFMYKRFKNLFIEINEMPMSEQHKILKNTIESWMGKTEQVDDILVIGIRL